MTMLLPKLSFAIIFWSVLRIYTQQVTEKCQRQMTPALPLLVNIWSV